LLAWVAYFAPGRHGAGGGAEGFGRFRALCVVGAFLCVGLLWGCGGDHDLGGIPLPSFGMPEAAAPSGLEKGMAGRLEKGEAGIVIKYHAEGGPELDLVLGPKYESARGLTCRTGHVNGASVSTGLATSYAFCRIDGKWHAMRAVVISGY
jgi:hypothetical protein